MEDGEFRLARGALSTVSKNFDVAKSTVHRLWKRAVKNRNNPQVHAYRATPQKKGRSGRKPLYDREALAEEIAALPVRKRRTLRSMAAALGVPKSTLFDIKDKEDDIINPHTNAIKPFLTEENKITRLAYAALEVVPDGNGAGGYVFDGRDDVVHFDEKWF